MWRSLPCRNLSIGGVRMFPAVLGIVAPIVGALAGAAISHHGGERARKQNIALAREQMAFQERMSSTSYQRAVRDMRAAGINPMMAAGRGGASTPSGALTKVEDTITPALSTAKQAAMLKREMRIMDAQAEKIEAEGAEVRARTNAYTGHWTQYGGKVHWVPGLWQEQLHQLQEVVRGARYDNVLREVDSMIYGSALGPWLRGAQHISGAIPRIGFGYGRVGSRTRKPKDQKGVGYRIPAFWTPGTHLRRVGPGPRITDPSRLIGPGGR